MHSSRTSSRAYFYLYASLLALSLSACNLANKAATSAATKANNGTSGASPATGGSGSGGVIVTPSVGTPVTPIAPTGGFRTYYVVKNPATTASPKQIITIGQPFAPGEVPAAGFLSASLKGAPVALQVDKKAAHADGSLRHAILTFEVPALAAGESANLKIFNSTTDLAGVAPSLTDLLSSNYDVTVSINLAGTTLQGSAKTALTALDPAAANWLRGPLVTEFNAKQSLNEFITIYYNVRYHRDGVVQTDVIVANDWAFKAGIRTLTYDVTVRQGGATVFTKTAQKHNRYANWRLSMYSNNLPPQIQWKRDLLHLRKTKSIYNYRGDVTIDEGAIASLYNGYLTSDRSPNGGSLITRYMPTTGGRSDIGPEPAWVSLYLVSQDPRLAEVMYAQANAGGSIPWHLRDPSTNLPITRDAHPYVWFDGRCSQAAGNNSTRDCPADGYDLSDTEWTPDTSHQPSLFYVPYLLSGDKYYADELSMVAAANINFYNITYFNNNGNFYWQSGSDQVRGSAWSLRTVANAAYVLPDSDPMKAYFAKIVDNDLTYGYQRFQAAGPLQGELSGYVSGYNFGSPTGDMAPWQDDYMTIVYGFLYQRGFTKAKAILDWKLNFTAGRFLQNDAVYCVNRGPGYYLLTKQNNVLLTTWNAVYNSTYATDLSCPVVMDGYYDWAGGYASSAMGANATLAQYGYSAANQAYQVIKARTTFWMPSNTRSGYPSDMTYAISPDNVDALAPTAEPAN